MALLPTDTVYGLAAIPTNPGAVSRIYALKNRPLLQNLPIMVSSVEEIEPLGFVVSEAARRLLDSPLIPGSLTFALGFRSGSVVPWLEGREEAALRIPNEPWLLSVLAKVGPLLVTSANLHGRETPDNVHDILANLKGSPDVAVDGGVLHTVPSTLVNCRCVPPVVERVGAIPEQTVKEFIK
ncbi:MAG: L-threonylcarbamoyladenylate synthase [Acidobacteriaceae bacterium]|nr:L-threonylcarbamoyladenylate synthase [Acidobacteriaceae bacterium]